MSYSIPIEIKTYESSVDSFKDYIMNLNPKNDTMIFLSEKCYSLLKENSIYLEQKDTKVFKQHNNNSNTKSYIETINIDSSNWSFLKNIFSADYHYEYSNGIPKKVVIIISEDEKKHLYDNISVSVIEPNNVESPVDCIINIPDYFEDSIVFLNVSSYQRLKRNTNIISNYCYLERLIWNADERYPGGEIMLHCVNTSSLYLIYSMNFPFFSKNFSFNKIPMAIYFIS